MGEPEYFKDYEWETLDNGDYVQKWTGKYRAFTTKRCKLIPIEIDRLEYLIAYCLKNYYIKHANQVAHGEFIPKWRYDNLADAAKLDYDKRSDELDAQHVHDGIAKWRDSQVNDCGHYNRIRDLENKLDTIKRIADYE